MFDAGPPAGRVRPPFPPPTDRPQTISSPRLEGVSWLVPYTWRRSCETRPRRFYERLDAPRNFSRTRTILPHGTLPRPATGDTRLVLTGPGRMRGPGFVEAWTRVKKGGIEDQAATGTPVRAAPTTSILTWNHRHVSVPGTLCVARSNRRGMGKAPRLMPARAEVILYASRRRPLSVRTGMRIDQNRAAAACSWVQSLESLIWAQRTDGNAQHDLPPTDSPVRGIFITVEQYPALRGFSAPPLLQVRRIGIADARSVDSGAF